MSDNKTGFQVERIAFFSDAVFAIAITLMIIEVKPPHLHDGESSKEAINGLLNIAPMFFGVALSFIFIGLFWVRHHQLMRYVENYTSKFISLNMAFLLTIIFLPFSTAFVFENNHSSTVVPMVFYNVNYIFAALLNYMLFSYTLNKGNGLVGKDAPSIAQYRLELLFPIVVYTLVIVVSTFSLQYGPICYAAFAFQSVLRRRKKR
ncbi:DUF1211 domain-containing protein [Taibaiella lutea]|uniref:DUF1211 domain-containing protein n=1 Tax=Taibaiella lutea TaxID=2608001 RepID=A0A5M6CBZ1_9BACT|nr:TMEM175 family protein [Taibaiella lutea]KAA5532571.1 DUF1211 domain-containing protein [Taibaiella lutea]